MKKFVAVGHWAVNKNTTSVAEQGRTKADFAEMLKFNGFVAYSIISEEVFRSMKEMDCFAIYDAVKAVTPNYRKYNEVTDYIEQCYDIMETRLEEVQ